MSQGALKVAAVITSTAVMAIGQRGVLVGNMAYARGIGQRIDAMGRSMGMTTHRKIQKVSGRLGC